VTFADGDQMLDSQPVTGGTASISTPLAPGKHTLKAWFVPAQIWLFVPSTSDAVTVTVTDTTIRHRAAGR
jgi:hypothetical protein